MTAQFLSSISDIRGSLLDIEVYGMTEEEIAIVERKS